jgi:hypothetical protein
LLTVFIILITILAEEDILIEHVIKKNSVAFSPQANYTDRTATACLPS